MQIYILSSRTGVEAGRATTGRRLEAVRRECARGTGESRRGSEAAREARGTCVVVRDVAATISSILPLTASASWETWSTRERRQARSTADTSSRTLRTS